MQRLDQQIDPIEYLIYWWFIGYPHDCSHERRCYRDTLTKTKREEIHDLYRIRRCILREHGLDPAEPLFCHQIAEVDFAHWSRYAFWWPEEAAALSLGTDPGLISRDSLVSRGLKPELFFFSKVFFGLCELMERAQQLGQIDERMRPGDFLTWAKRNRVHFPEELERQVLAHGDEVVDWKCRCEALEARVREERAERDRMIEELREHIRPNEAQRASKPLHPRERNTMLKLIGGMARAYYGYDPDAKRTETVGMIVNDLSRKGVNVSEDTVRKYMNESKEILPRSAEPAGDSAD